MDQLITTKNVMTEIISATTAVAPHAKLNSVGNAIPPQVEKANVQLSLHLIFLPNRLKCSQFPI
jgi:hypothetical protein